MAELMPDNTLDAQIFDYMIIIDTVNGDEVRFGIETHDFLQFMRSRHPDVDVPPLPFDEADPDEDREILRAKVVMLRMYMRNLLAIPEIFDDACIPMFLQSHTPMPQIREIIASQEAAAVRCFNRQRANNQNAQRAAANNDQQVAANNPQQAAAEANNDQQVAANNPQQAADEANNDQQVAANNPQQAAAEANNDQQVAANNPQQAAAEANNDQQVPAKVEYAQQAAIGNRDDNESSDGELAVGGNSSGNESDEPIFHMEDV